MRDFKKYDIWQLSHELTLEVYKITSIFPKEELFGITSQLRRATSSIPTNISEGCGRNSDKEFNQFLNIALGSALETEYLLILSKDLNYLNQEKFQDLELKINNIKSKIYKLKQKLT
ncbi:MAG: four helix bundle protein [Flavobacterium sp.]|uniref:Four helix bundle protein n=1 Tax=Flavobacterium celericrescens TaxID=2709780 RepID=A0ABX0IE57_9FLAO|nr:four helix bundle protein [Flavobacterium celericrescens]NHM04475.1 four helix bundle protein [Flavobacterium celericrescens]